MTGTHFLGTVRATGSWAMLNCVCRTCTDGLVSGPIHVFPASGPGHRLLHPKSCVVSQRMGPCDIKIKIALSYMKICFYMDSYIKNTLNKMYKTLLQYTYRLDEQDSLTVKQRTFD